MLVLDLLPLMGAARADRWTTTGIWIVGLAAAFMSWDGWFSLARMCGWPWWLAAFLPFAVDVYVVVSARVWLRMPWVSRDTRRFAACSAWCAIVVSIAANSAYHLMASKGWRLAPWPVVVAVSGLAPLMLALVAHLQARLNADHATSAAAASVPDLRDVAPDAAPDVATSVSPEPAPVATSDPAEPATSAPAATPSKTRPVSRPKRQKTPRVATPSRGKRVAEPEDLTDKRAEGLQHLAAGKTTAETAELCGVDRRTVQRWNRDAQRMADTELARLLAEPVSLNGRRS
jgi:hypothetical protein